MKEIEVMVTFDNKKEDVLNVLSQFEYVGEKEIIDTYFIDPLRKNLEPESDLRLNETFRIRKYNDTCYLTYKKQHFKGKQWVYSDEYETKVEDYETIKKIVFLLGLEELITVHNKRTIFKTKDYEIVFEDVKNLGYFIEVEKLGSDDKDELEIKEELRSFIRSLKLNNVRELNIGKNQFLLSKKMKVQLNIYNDTKYE